MNRRRITFDTRGDLASASARLRSWMIADELRRRGYDAACDPEQPGDVHVLQKVRRVERLKQARERGALVVFDFDDHYLLDEVGVRNETIAFMNLVDVVTVGSPVLYDAASALHERVVFFENPLDVASPEIRKTAFGWHDRVCWFGAPENAGVLDDTGLRGRVTTLTKGGDLPWMLETIDDTLIGFDLVVIPVVLTEWTAAKNANRLLKCAALGVPALVSRTPEHERIAGLLQLPDWLLVESDEEWPSAIARVAARAQELPALMDRARDAAFRHFGIEPTVDRWIETVLGLDPTIPAPISVDDDVRERCTQIDLVVLADDPEVALAPTLESLGPVAEACRGRTLITSMPVDPSLDLTGWTIREATDDFFAVYGLLADVIGGARDGSVLLLRAGVRARPGFFAAAAAATGEICLFDLQVDYRTRIEFERAPDRIDELLKKPYVPGAVLLPDAGGVPGLPHLGPLLIWDLLIKRIGAGESHRVVTEPLAMIAAPARTRTAVDAYWSWMGERDPDSLIDLPDLAKERERTGWQWHAAVIESNRPIFERYVSTLVPGTKGTPASKSAARRFSKTTLSREWQEAVRNARPGQVALVSDAEDGLWIVEDDVRRAVPYRVIARSLAPVTGPVQHWEPDRLGALPEGPPVELFEDEKQRVWLIIGGLRYRIWGVPRLKRVTTDEVDQVPASDRVLRLSGGGAAHVLTGTAAEESPPPLPQETTGQRPRMGMGDMTDVQRRVANVVDRLGIRRVIVLGGDDDRYWDAPGSDVAVEVVPEIDPAAIPHGKVEAYLRRCPSLQRATGRLAREELSALEMLERAMDRVIAAMEFPVLVLSANAMPVGELPRDLPADWAMLLLGGYRVIDDLTIGQGVWTSASKGWRGPTAFAVATIDAALSLRGGWSQCRATLDESWTPALAESGALGVEPPMFVETNLLTAGSEPMRGKRIAGHPLANAPIWFTNLDRRPDRRRSVYTQLRGWSGSVRRAGAVEGLLLSADEVERYRALRSADQPPAGERLLRGELAATRTHRLLLEEVIAAGIYPAIVFEDDVRLEPGWDRTPLPASWDLLLLGSIRVPEMNRASYRAGLPTGWLGASEGFWLLAHAYVIGNEETARALHTVWSREDRVTDHAWQPVLHAVRTWAHWPPLARQADDESDMRTINPGSSLKSIGAVDVG